MLRANHLGVSVVLMDDDEEDDHRHSCSYSGSPHSSAGHGAMTTISPTTNSANSTSTLASASASAAAILAEGEESAGRHVCSFPGCTRTYARREHLKRHIKVHQGSATLACRICGRRFHRKDHLKHHELAHTDDRPYLCAEPGCGRTYRQRCSLSQHQRSSGHSGKVDRRAQQLQAQKAEQAAAAAMAAQAAAVVGLLGTADSPSSSRRGMGSSSSSVHSSPLTSRKALGHPSSRQAPATSNLSAAAGYVTIPTKEDPLGLMAASRAAAAAVASLGTSADWDTLLATIQDDGSNNTINGMNGSHFNSGGITVPNGDVDHNAHMQVRDQVMWSQYINGLAGGMMTAAAPSGMMMANDPSIYHAHTMFPRDVLLQVTSASQIQGHDKLNL